MAHSQEQAYHDYTPDSTVGMNAHAYKPHNQSTVALCSKSCKETMHVINDHRSSIVNYNYMYMY